ncbi:hypothetical protein BRC87_09975, partial [Halobacteriales archaeon QS_4_66_20]
SRRSTSTIFDLLGFVLTDLTVYPDAVCLFNTAAITMTKEQGRILGIISIVLSTLTLTYAALWFAGLV